MKAEPKKRNYWPKAVVIIMQDAMLLAFLCFCVYACTGGFS